MKFLITLIVVFVAAIAAFTFVGTLISDGGPTINRGKSLSFSDLLDGRDDSGGGPVAVGSSNDWRSRHVHIMGDSLTVSAERQLEEAIPGASIDGRVSRGMTAGVSIYREWMTLGLVEENDIIVFALANNVENGTITSLDSLIGDIGPKQSLVLVTGHGLENMRPINEYIRTLPDKYSFIVVADWDEAISANSSWLADDGIHISDSRGNKLYADVIVDALERVSFVS